MSLGGRLGDVQLRDLVSLVGGRRMSGKLSLRNETDGGAILFREGKIVAAVSSRDPQSIGSLLVAEDHIGGRELHEAVELHRHDLVSGRLTRVLERKGAVATPVLEEVVHRKVRRIMHDLLEWSAGYFRFEPMRVSDSGEIEIDPGEFVEITYAAAEELETELKVDSAVADSFAMVAEGPPEGGGRPTIGAFELETPGPRVSGEATLAILSAGREELRRGVLFVARNDAFAEVAAVGVEEAGSNPSAPGGLEIPRQATSILRDAAEWGASVRAPLEEGEWNEALVDRLGHGWPEEAVAIPAIVGGRTILIFYGEGATPSGVPRLEEVMKEVALSMERDLVKRRERWDGLGSDSGLDGLRESPEPATLSALSRKVDRLIEQNEALLREYQLREQSFWHLAHHDPLTGLPNRFLFREHLAKEIAHARQEGDLLAVAVFDLDHFRDVNDHLGEGPGDEILSDVAARISGIVRVEDTLARLSGDQFAIVLPKCSQADHAMLVVRRVFDAFAEPFRAGQNEILLSFSMGVSFYPEDGRTPSELVLHAEEALRRAKESGRNNFQVYAPPMNEWAQVRMELAQDLRRAIAESEGLHLLFQPIVAVDTGRVVAAEALLRWQPPERSLIEPRTLIELAEDTGQMPALGAWVLREACGWTSQWQRSLDAVPIWVNVSIRQFQAGRLVEAVTRALHETEVAPELLRLEITESIAALNVPNVRETLDRLEKLGVSVVLDDFGAGYSSLSYILRFSVTGLKIAGSFVRDVPSRPEACAVVEAGVGIGRRLELDVVGEGVEDEEQLDFLRESACPLAQGMYFSEPLTPSAFERLLRDGQTGVSTA